MSPHIKSERLFVFSLYLFPFLDTVSSVDNQEDERCSEQSGEVKLTQLLYLGTYFTLPPLCCRDVYCILWCRKRRWMEEEEGNESVRLTQQRKNLVESKNIPAEPFNLLWDIIWSCDTFICFKFPRWWGGREGCKLWTGKMMFYLYHIIEAFSTFLYPFTSSMMEWITPSASDHDWVWCDLFLPTGYWNQKSVHGSIIRVQWRSGEGPAWRSRGSGGAGELWGLRSIRESSHPG